MNRFMPPFLKGHSQSSLPNPITDVDDNTLLPVLDKEHILANLKNRFHRDCIYTFTASVVLAVNPWKTVHDLYSADHQMLYTNKSLHSLPPHPYALADTAYRYFYGENKSQALVISGESGSGKTETAKTVISFLASHKERRRLKTDGQITSHAAAVVHDKIMSANPILEAFGNASTIRNKNSSRFGKYHRLLYDRTGGLVGADIKPFLLESSRVTGVSGSERNYHVFYQIIAGMQDRDLDKLFLAKEGVYPLIAHGKKQSEADKADDKEKFNELVHAFSVVGFEVDDVKKIFQIVAGLLLLSSVCFEAPIGSSSTADDAEDSSKSSKPCAVRDMHTLEQAAGLFGVETSALNKVLLYKQSKINNRGSTYLVPRSLTQVEATRATLIRMIYKRLFERMVAVINELVHREGEKGDVSPISEKSQTLHIGILDIFGFENLEKNSFEQLCINLTNEKLQQFFIRKVLESEQKTYQAEGIASASVDVMKIPLPDCSETLGTIRGVLDMLDDHCIRLTRNMTTDEEKFCLQLYNQFHADQIESKLVLPRLGKHAKNRPNAKSAAKVTDAFVIKHYAGEVMYTVGGWFEKNNERMSPEMEVILRDSKSDWMASLSDHEACSYACERFKSVKQKFVTELDAMLAMLDKCYVHYVRCFNPNPSQVSGVFDVPYVTEQVVQCGTVELVKVMQLGFPNRQPLKLIAEKFQAMLPHEFRDLTPRDFVHAIMHAFGVPKTEFAIGFTTLFLKAEQIKFLEELKGVGEMPSSEILNKIRRLVAIKKFKRCVHTVQAALWIPKLKKQIRRKKLFQLAANLAVTIAFILPKMRPLAEAAKARVAERKRREEEARLRAIEEARIKAEEEARLRAIEEARLRAEEEARIKAEEEARLKAEEEARIKAEEEAREEARIQAEEARIQAEKESRLIQAEEESRLIQAEKESRLIRAEKESENTSQNPISPRAKYLANKSGTSTIPSLPMPGVTAPQMQVGTSLAKLPAPVSEMARSVALFALPQGLIIFDGRQLIPISTTESNVPGKRRSSMGTALPSLVPTVFRNATTIGAIAQHPIRKDVFATTQTDEVGAISIWRALRGVESRFRIHLGNNGSANANPTTSTSILKMCFIAPDNANVKSPALSATAHLLAVLVECSGEASSSRYLIFVEVAIPAKSKGGSTKDLTAAPPPQFKVHKVEPIPDSQYVAASARCVNFLETSASGRVVTVGGKGLLMMFVVGMDAGNTIQIDLLAEQTYFPQIQTTNFLAFVSLFPRDTYASSPEDYEEEQLIVSSSDGNMLRFPILLNQTTCALDISGCGKIRECNSSLFGKRIAGLVKKSDDMYYSVTSDGCIDKWSWADGRPFRDPDCSIALVAEHSKAMFSTARMSQKEIVCLDADAGKVICFDPSDPEKLSPKLLYQFGGAGRPTNPNPN